MEKSSSFDDCCDSGGGRYNPKNQNSRRKPRDQKGRECLGKKGEKIRGRRRRRRRHRRRPSWEVSDVGDIKSISAKSSAPSIGGPPLARSLAPCPVLFISSCYNASFLSCFLV